MSAPTSRVAPRPKRMADAAISKAYSCCMVCSESQYYYYRAQPLRSSCVRLEDNSCLAVVTSDKFLRNDSSVLSFCGADLNSGREFRTLPPSGENSAWAKTAPYAP